MLDRTQTGTEALAYAFASIQHVLCHSIFNQCQLQKITLSCSTESAPGNCAQRGQSHLVLFLTPGDFAGNGTLSQVRLVMGPITPEQSRLKQ